MIQFIQQFNKSARLLIFCFILSQLFTSCNAIQSIIQNIFGSQPKSWRDYISPELKASPNHAFFNNIPADSTKQLIIWRTPKQHQDDTYLNFWLDSVYKHDGPFTINVFCGACGDSSLMLLTGPGIKTLIQGGGGTKGGGSACSSSSCPPAGGHDTIYWCVNFPIDISDSVQYIDGHRIPLHVGCRDTAVTVAVFDTGIDSSQIDNYLYKSSIPSCLSPLANNGWNYPADSNNVNDDYHSPIGHGAIVSMLITEQVRRFRQNSVNILPVKIHNKNGESDLFSVLCGFAYAKERGAKIINASFGYYALKPNVIPGSVPVSSVDPGAMLLKEYIKHYLTSNNILLIAAAGNAQPNNDASLRALYTSQGLTPPNDLRNLNNVNFYPASLAKDPEMTNVIAVTTADDKMLTTSPIQNYSDSVVDVGVTADLIQGKFFYFSNPRVDNGFCEGSSFATPVVAGIICSHYNIIKNNLSTAPFTKDNILRYLLDNQSLDLGRLTDAGKRVRVGVFVHKSFR